MQSKKKHIIIYSHGFGVRKDDNGLLSDIADAFPEIESVLFDYNDVDEINGTLTVYPFSTQVKRLQEVLAETRSKNPEAVIDLIGHSQGTLIAALARLKGIRKIIFLAPPFKMDIERSLERYRTRPGNVIDLEGTSRLPGTGGFIRIVPKEYWTERIAVKPFEEYNKLAEHNEIIAITAKQDNRLLPVDLKNLNPKIKIISVDGDHDFSGDAREFLIKEIRKIIN